MGPCSTSSSWVCPLSRRSRCSAFRPQPLPLPVCQLFWHWCAPSGEGSSVLFLAVESESSTGWVGLDRAFRSSFPPRATALLLGYLSPAGLHQGHLAPDGPLPVSLPFQSSGAQDFAPSFCKKPMIFFDSVGEDRPLLLLGDWAPCRRTIGR